LFPYYIPIIEFNFESELNILYSQKDKVATFKQNNQKENIIFKGLEDNELGMIFSFLEKKNNVQITVLENPVSIKIRAKNYLIWKHF
jgi:hypothetical protein